ncbi:unknown [[Mannheimia] succiniciproducens MBEL55E]|uniref:Uncharacterized protein n=1 Tax=Mannheimia succiniciproducens (strain KCTC 0769BP / MBEL55E) TaxID=221988 RepID=Q65VF2_MANSM|nr:unknown [[Mannheimia] succiniciproducens MBEL55E]
MRLILDKFSENFINCAHKKAHLILLNTLSEKFIKI